MKELPIIFSGEMVRAILDGRKTQTRRVVKPQPNPGPQGKMISLGGGYWAALDGDMWGEWKCPYGQLGDLLYVREAFTVVEDSTIEDPGMYYRADGDLPSHIDDSVKWKPSIHMPKWAARFWLEVTGIRVERVQDISEEDAEAEGAPKDRVIGYGSIGNKTHREGFILLWDAINHKRPGCSWEDNPYVWIVEFKPTTPAERG